MKIFVWNFRSLLLGVPGNLEFHSERSAYCIASLDRSPFRCRIRSEKNWNSYTGILIPKTGIALELESESIALAALTLDPIERMDFESEKQASIFPLPPDLEELFRSTSLSLEINSDDEKKRKELLEELDRLFPPKYDMQSIDPRILAVLERISETIEENLSTEILGQEVGLSRTRLEHLFKESLGISLTEHRTWQRLKAATLSISKGETLTQAAQTAGFFDSSHYTNSFKKAFGISPSVLLNSDSIIYFS